MASLRDFLFRAYQAFKSNGWDAVSSKAMFGIPTNTAIVFLFKSTVVVLTYRCHAELVETSEEAFDRLRLTGNMNDF